MKNADYQVGIVGAGFAGLVAALRLKKEGKNSFIIFERASEVGGTWRENVYPGCACDVASPLYSFFDEPNPEWDNLYSSQPQILNYLKKVVDKNDLYQHLSLNTDISTARFIKDEGYWEVEDKKGNVTKVTVLILAMGPLNRPSIPKFEGIEEFRGKYFHSSQWDLNFDLKDKRVAVIGTGASAIQIVPAIAPMVEKLVVFQRTPAWVLFRNDRNIPQVLKRLYKKIPLLQRIRREMIYWINEFFGLGFIGNKTMNRLMKWAAKRKLRKEVKDSEIRRQLTPNYTIGCKRILKSDDYYPTFNRSNVQIVTECIKRFSKDGIIINDGTEHKLDTVIFGTGFVAADIELYTKVIGLDGKNIIDEWKENGAEAYLGTTMSGYPNAAFILGPNTGLGHNSVVHMMESQMNYILQYISYLEQQGVGSYLNIKKEAQQNYNEQLQSHFRGTVWSSGCSSWYMNKKGKNTTLYPGLTLSFRRKTKRFDPSVYYVIHQKDIVEKKSIVTV